MSTFARIVVVGLLTVLPVHFPEVGAVQAAAYAEAGVTGPVTGSQPDWSPPSAGQVDVVKILLAAGADPEARDRSGRTPFIDAAMQGNLEALRALLSGGS